MSVLWGSPGKLQGCSAQPGPFPHGFPTSSSRALGQGFSEELAGPVPLTLFFFQKSDRLLNKSPRLLSAAGSSCSRSLFSAKSTGVSHVGLSCVGMAVRKAPGAAPLAATAVVGGIGALARGRVQTRQGVSLPRAEEQGSRTRTDLGFRSLLLRGNESCAWLLRRSLG